MLVFFGCFFFFFVIVQVGPALGATAPGPGPFGTTVLSEIRGAERAGTADGWREGKLCEIDASLNNSDATSALRAAILACGNREEGGTVLIAAGLTVYSGSLWLASNLTLRIEGDLLGVGVGVDAGEEEPTMVYTRRESIMTWAYAGLLNGGRCLKMKEPLVGWDDCAEWEKLENVAVEGGGIVDGRAHDWDDGNQRPMLLDLLWIRGLTLRDLRVTGSAYWTVHPCFCDDVVVRNLSVVTEGKNTDGLDPDSCWNVLIEGNYFSNGDDNIALKSGRDWSGRMVNVSTRNVLARHNVYATGHAGFAIGSETSGGILDVISTDSIHIDNDKAVRIKTARGRGGLLRNLTYANLTGTVKAAISLTLEYSKGIPPTNDSATPELRDVFLRNITLTSRGDFDDEKEKVPLLALLRKQQQQRKVDSSAKWTYLECAGLDDSHIDAVHFRDVVVKPDPDYLRHLTASCSFCSGATDDISSPTPCFLDSPS